MAAISSFPDSGWERIPEGSAFFIQMRQSLIVSIPRRSQGTRKSALEEVV